MDSGPIPRPFHQILLTAVRESIPKPLDLGGILGADHNRLVATPEDLLLPAGQKPDRARVDVLVSWNFKHIVNLQRIHGYNSVNLRQGYPIIEIRTPREVLSDE